MSRGRRGAGIPGDVESQEPQRNSSGDDVVHRFAANPWAASGYRTATSPPDRPVRPPHRRTHQRLRYDGRSSDQSSCNRFPRVMAADAAFANCCRNK